METVHAKEEAKKLRQMLQDLRQKLADAEAKVGIIEQVQQIEYN
jgi:hypothetical protein